MIHRERFTVVNVQTILRIKLKYIIFGPRVDRVCGNEMLNTNHGVQIAGANKVTEK